jgi:hypothetical protein
MERRRFPILAMILLGLTILGLGLVISRVLLPLHHAETDRMIVDWEASGWPKQVTGVVVDAEGKPATGLCIVINGRPTTETVVTDAQGRFSASANFGQILNLSVEKADSVNWTGGPFDKGLDCGNGLLFHIRLRPNP